MTGGAFHALIGTLAVGFLLILPPVLITAVIFAGAAYMASIGVTLLRSSITIGAIGKAADRSLAIAYRQGLLTTLLNPKGYLFVVAVYPQFIKPQFGPVWQQGVIMGAMLMLTMLAVYGVLILAAGSARTFLSAHPNVTIAFGRAAGAVFILVAAITAWHAMSIA